MRRTVIIGSRVLLLLLVLAAAYSLHTVYDVHLSSNRDPVEIVQGSSLRRIASTLHEHDIIGNEYVFILAAKLSGKSSSLQSGYYQFPTALNISSVLDILSAGSHQAVRIFTIPEGYTIDRMATALSRTDGYSRQRILSLCRDRAFLDSMGIPGSTAEGYLLPETYQFRYDEDEEDVLRTMIGQMRSVFTPRLLQDMATLGLTRHRVLTMASIIEGETNLDGERARIAGVYYNRLRRGMLLQADPTVQYIIDDGPRRLLYRDLAIDSRYNTYRYPGLPPGPVNNPGAASIRAAVYPEKHNYLYFVADGSGGHKFSRNYDEHNRAVEEYRRWRRSNGR